MFGNTEVEGKFENGCMGVNLEHQGWLFPFLPIECQTIYLRSVFCHSTLNSILSLAFRDCSVAICCFLLNFWELYFHVYTYGGREGG